MTCLLPFVCLFSYTYAWQTSKDSVVNNFLGGLLEDPEVNFGVIIDELFTPTDSWVPGDAIKKEVKVKNEKEAPAIVRVSLYEYLLLFKTNPTNANVLTSENPVLPEVSKTDPTTWAPAAAAGGTYSTNGKHYVTRAAQVSDIDNRQGMVDYANLATSRNTTLVGQLALQFPDASIATTVQAGATSDYWLYEDGYFYFSRVLLGGETTIPMFKGLKTADTLGNKYKHGLYRMSVLMDAHEPSQDLVTDWKLSTSSKAYALLSPYLN